MKQPFKEIARGYIQTFRTVGRLLLCRQMSLCKLTGIPVNLLAWLIKRRPPFPPPVLQLDITDMCNLHCPECLTGMGFNKNRQGMMAYETFQTLINDVGRSTAVVVLYNSGEPLLHPDAVKMIRHLAENRIASVISTNGHFVKTREAAEALVSSGLSVMIVSLSGATPTIYTQYHRGGDLAQVIKGVRYVREAKKKFKKKTPIIIFRFLIMDHNIHEAKAMADLAEQEGCDWYEFRRVNWRACPVTTPPDAVPLRNGLPPRKRSRHCLWPWLIAVVDWTGDVYPCCFFRLNLPVMGNTADAGGMKTIWRSAAYNRFREIMRSGAGGPPACLGCPAETGFQTRFSGQKRTVYVYHPANDDRRAAI